MVLSLWGFGVFGRPSFEDFVYFIFFTRHCFLVFGTHALRTSHFTAVVFWVLGVFVVFGV